jgi:hypothetical protein
MRKMLDGFVVDDRRGESKDAPVAVGAPEVLEHTFVLCPCKRHEYMLMSGETPLTKCPQDDWQWGFQMAQPFYATGVRVLEDQKREAKSYNERATEQMMVQLAQQMRHRGHNV